MRSAGLWVRLPGFVSLLCLFLPARSRSRYLTIRLHFFFFFYNVAVILDLPLGGVRTQQAAVHTDLRRAPGSMVQLP